MDVKQHKDYWFDGAEKDMEAAKGLYNIKQYAYCLFFIHLALEKTLKALVVQKTVQPAPYIHNLLILSEYAGIELTDQRADFFDTVNTFQIEARYPDFKYSLEKKASREYTQQVISKTEEIISWLKKTIK